MSDERPDVLGRDWRVEGNDTSGYIGTGDEYRNYANETEKPYLAPGELLQLHQRGQVTDEELNDLRVQVAAGYGAVVEPQSAAGMFDPEEDRKYTNVDVPEGVTTTEGETSYGQTLDEDGNVVDAGDSDEEVVDEDKKSKGDSGTTSGSSPEQAPENSSGSNTSDSGFSGRKI